MPQCLWPLRAHQCRILYPCGPGRVAAGGAALHGMGAGVSSSAGTRVNITPCLHALADPARWRPCDDPRGLQPAIMPRVRSRADSLGVTMAAASILVPDLRRARGVQPAMMPRVSRADKGVAMAATSIPVPADPGGDQPAISAARMSSKADSKGVAMAAASPAASLPGPDTRPLESLPRGPSAPNLILPRAAACPVVSKGVAAAFASSAAAPVSDGP